MEVAGLEPREEELCRGHVVAVGAELHQRDLESLKQPLRAWFGVVAGVVPEDDGVLPPVLVLGVEHADELGEVDLHDLPIAVGLEEAEEDANVVVHTSDEGDPGLDADLLLPRPFFLWLPATSLISN